MIDDVLAEDVELSPPSQRDGWPRPWLPHGRVWLTAFVILILGQMLAGMFIASASDSLTYDEPYHIGAAVGYVDEHDVSLNWEHPPLAKWLAGVVLWMDGTAVNSNDPTLAAHDDVGFGHSVIYSPENDAGRVKLMARLPLILLTAFFGLLVFGFARDLWGTRGGLLSVALFSVTPDVLAHGHLVTTDMAVSGFLVMTMWGLWRARYRNPRYLILASVGMGLALASKFTALVFLPIFAALVALAVVHHTVGMTVRRRLFRVVGVTAGAGLAALAILWLSYLIIDPTLTYSKPPHPAGVAARGLMATIADLLPVPDAYRQGLRFAIGAEAGRPGFLLGHHYTGGSVFFYPVGLLIKTPIGALVLWSAGAAVAIRRRRQDVALFLALPMAVWLGIALTSQINIGVRHVLPVVALATVLAGGAACNSVASRWRALGPAALLAAAISTWVAFPNYLSYSNEAFGGVGHTYEVLADSSADWGQDLQRFAAWNADHPTSGPLYFAYFGTAPLASVGLSAERPPPITAIPLLTSGRLAISASIYDAYDDHPGQYERLGAPDHVIGGSILVWDLPISHDGG